MFKRIAAFILIALPGAVPGSSQTPDEGRVNYQQLDAPYLDQYTSSPSLQQWFLSHFMLMGVFAPYFNDDTAWYPSAVFYDDSYAIYPGTAVATDHPEWILHDQNGDPLYISWGCSGGTCPQYAADIASPAYRVWWISQARHVMNSAGYKGIWVDDVNLSMNVCDADGNPTAPIDDNTGLPMTSAAWGAYMAAFMQQIRESFPYAEIIQNTIWYASPSGATPGFDTSVQQQVKSATNINLERGVASDPGLTGGTGPFSVYQYFAYIDQVHALGPSVTLEQYQLSPDQQEYGLAAYFMISNGGDRIGDGSTSPENWFAGYSVELGAALGPRSYSNGVFQRSFANGIVLLGEPGLATETISLPGVFTKLDGIAVSSVSLSGSQGIVLSGSTLKRHITRYHH